MDNEQKQGEEQTPKAQQPTSSRSVSGIRTPSDKPADDGSSPLSEKFIPVRLPGTSGRDVSDIPDIIDNEEASEDLHL